jgi:hypothetical protein
VSNGKKGNLDHQRMMGGIAALKKKRSAACSHGYICNIPASYEINPETLERVKEATAAEVGTPVAVFKALADPLRLRILKALRVSDLCVCVFEGAERCRACGVRAGGELSDLSSHGVRTSGTRRCGRD